MSDQYKSGLPDDSPHKKRPPKLVLIPDSPVPRRKERADSKTRSSHVSFQGKELLLLKQKEETKSQLKELGKKKQQLMQEGRAAREPLLQKTGELSNLLQELFESYQIQSSSLSSKQRIKESTNQARLQACQASLTPLENELRTVEKDKARTVQHEKTLDEQARAAENLLSMYAEEIRARLFKRAEFIAQREENEELLEQLKINHPENFEGHAEDWEVRDSLANLRGTNKQKSIELEEVSAALANSVQALKHSRRTLSDTKAEMTHLIFTHPNKESVEELEKLELYFELKAQEGGPSIEDIVVDLNSLEGFDIDEAVLRTQLKLVDEKESELHAQWDQYNKSIEESLKKASEEDDWDEMEILEDQQFSNCRKFHNRLASIVQWKAEVDNALGPYRPLRAVTTDELIAQEFIKKLGQGNSNVENMLNVYIQKAKAREQSLQAWNSPFEQIAVKANQVEAQVLLSQQENRQLEARKLGIRKEMLNISIEQKKLAKRVGIEADLQITIKASDLQKTIDFWDSKINKESYIVNEELQEAIKEVRAKLKEVTKAAKHVKSQQQEMNGRSQTLKQQMERVEESQRREILMSIESDHLRNPQGEHAALEKMKQKMEDINRVLENTKQELRRLDEQNAEKLSQIEKEEASLRSQQHGIEAAIKNALLNQQQKPSNLRKSQEVVSESLNSNTNSNPKQSEAYYPVEIKERNSRTLFDKNPYFEVVEKSLGKKVVQPDYKKYYRLNLEDTTQPEKYFYEKVMPLLEGAELYKKFANKAKHSVFDPLDVVNRPPETCGYAIRQFRLHKSLTKIDVKQPLKPGFDTSIQVEQIMAPMIPQRTMTVLQFQKKLVHTDLEIAQRHVEGREEDGELISGHAFKMKCRDCKLYPFSIVMENGPRVEVIAKDYATFKLWVNGVNALVKYKKYLSKLKTRIESYTTV